MSLSCWKAVKFWCSYSVAGRTIIIQLQSSSFVVSKYTRGPSFWNTCQAKCAQNENPEKWYKVKEKKNYFLLLQWFLSNGHQGWSKPQVLHQASFTYSHLQMRQNQKQDGNKLNKIIPRILVTTTRFPKNWFMHEWKSIQTTIRPRHISKSLLLS